MQRKPAVEYLSCSEHGLETRTFASFSLRSYDSELLSEETEMMYSREWIRRHFVLTWELVSHLRRFLDEQRNA